jgi:hypothetical protein
MPVDKYLPPQGLGLIIRKQVYRAHLLYENMYRLYGDEFYVGIVVFEFSEQAGTRAKNKW